MLLARDGISVGSSSFYRFINSSCQSYMRKNITVRLPETEPGKYAQADFGYMGKIWDEERAVETERSMVQYSPCATAGKCMYT